MGNKGTHITVTYDYKLEKVYNKRLKKSVRKAGMEEIKKGNCSERERKKVGKTSCIADKEDIY